MFTISITADKLRELAKLADWQLRQDGFDPDSITAASPLLDDAAYKAAWEKQQAGKPLIDVLNTD